MGCTDSGSPPEPQSTAYLCLVMGLGKGGGLGPLPSSTEQIQSCSGEIMCRAILHSLPRTQMEVGPGPLTVGAVVHRLSQQGHSQPITNAQPPAGILQGSAPLTSSKMDCGGQEESGAGRWAVSR